MNSANPSRSFGDATRRTGPHGAVLLLTMLPVVGNLAGCSFQDFSYLQDNHGANGGSGGSSGSGGTRMTDGSTADSAGGSIALDATPDVDDGGPSATSDASDSGTIVPSDAPSVNMLANPSFEQGLNGWSFDPMTAQGKYAFTQYPVGTASIPDGQYELATWNATDAYRIRIFQTFTGLENGRYTFKGWFTRGDDNAAFVYSAGCGGADQQMAVPLTASTEWIQVGVGGINVTNGQCEVGFVVDANANNWLNADAFTFERDPQ